MFGTYKKPRVELFPQMVPTPNPVIHRGCFEAEPEAKSSTEQEKPRRLGFGTKKGV